MHELKGWPFEPLDGDVEPCDGGGSGGGPGKFEDKTPYGEFVPRGFHPVQCVAMRKYAMSLGVPRRNILMQNFSSDTIGEAFFVKQMYLAPNRWYNNIIVTSKYHEARVSCIYDVVLGTRYHIKFETISTEKDNNNETLKGEKKEQLKDLRGIMEI